MKRETEALKYKMEQLDEERVKFEDKAYMAQQTSIKVFEESEYVSIHKKEYEDDRAELEKLRYELEAEKAHVRAEHLKLEHKRTEILMRERMVDQLKLNKVQEDLESHQRSGDDQKNYYNYGPYSGYKTDFRPSYNRENFSPNNIRYPATTQKQGNELSKERNIRSAKTEKPQEKDEGEKEAEAMYKKLNESAPVAPPEEAKQAFDFNSYDQDDDDDDYTEEDEEN